MLITLFSQNKEIESFAKVFCKLIEFLNEEVVIIVNDEKDFEILKQYGYNPEINEDKSYILRLVITDFIIQCIKIEQTY